MTTTAHWLHLRLGHPLIEIEAEDVVPVQEPECTEADVIARQKAYAAAPLAVRFTGR